MRIELLILKNRAKLEHMIKIGAPYGKILKQSQLLDKYINEKMKRLTSK